MTANPPPRNPQALPTQTPPFLTKLYQLVSDPNTQNLVSWTDEKGLSFTVHKPSEFGRDILPKYFKHNNFSSFVRQLNQYGFHKQNPDKWMFGHDSFRRDRPDLLKNISRRRPKQAQNSNLVLPTALTQNAVVELGNYGLEGELKSLKRDKDVLIKELVVTRQKEEQLKNRCENLETRVASLENSSKQMQAFIMHYFSQVLQPYSEAMASRKRKRLPATVEEPDAMIVEQPPNQVANISHSAGHSSVDALRVMMQQMGVGISRPPPQPQAQSPSSPQTPPRISFEPATIQELPQEESSATVSTSRRIMPPTAENTVALIHPPVFTQPVLTENPSTGPSTSISPSVPTPASGKSNAPSTSSQCVPVTSNVPSFNAPSPMSTPVIPEKVSANTTNAVTAARTPSQPIARTPNGSAPLASTPNSNNVNGSENTSSSIVSLPTLSVLPTPTVAASSSSPSDANHITSNTTMTSIPTSATNGTISNFNGAHAPIPESEASQFSTHQSSAIATPPALAAAYQAVHVVPLQTHPLPAHPLPTHPLQAHPSNTLPPNTLPPNVDPSNTHLLQSQHLHVNPIQGSVGVSTQELPATYLQTSEQPHVPFPELASTLAHSSNAVNNGNVGAEKTAGKEDIHMTNPEDGKMATSDGEKHVIDPDVERALDFLGDMPSTPNTSMTMDAIENALQAPRSQSKGTHLDTPDFDKAFDDKEFNMSFGNGQGSTKMNGQCPSSSENERVIEDFLELSADDPGLPLPLMHLPEGTDIHALAKRIESFADT